VDCLNLRIGSHRAAQCGSVDHIAGVTGVITHIIARGSNGDCCNKRGGRFGCGPNDDDKCKSRIIRNRHVLLMMAVVQVLDSKGIGRSCRALLDDES